MRLLAFCLITAAVSSACGGSDSSSSTPAGANGDGGGDAGTGDGANPADASSASDPSCGAPGNLVVNCDFQLGTSGWERATARSGTYPDTTAFVADDGNPAGSMRVVSTGQAIGGFVADPSTCLSDLAGKTAFSVKFDARTAAGTVTSCRIMLQGFSGTTCDGIASSPALGDSFQTTTSWQTTNGSVSLTKSAGSAMLMIDCSYTDETGELRLDNVIVRGT